MIVRLRRLTPAGNGEKACEENGNDEKTYAAIHPHLTAQFAPWLGWASSKEFVLTDSQREG